jgi:hypothetical protein
MILTGGLRIILMHQLNYIDHQPQRGKKSIFTRELPKVGKRVDKWVTKSMKICSRLHKVVQELIKGCRLPQLDEIGKNKFMEELVYKVQDSTNHRSLVLEVSTMIIIYLIEQHLLYPTKVHTMIYAFMTIFSKDMSTLEDSIAMHNATMEELIYQRNKYVYDHLEVWKTYLRRNIP